jgi:DNA ligase 1
MNDIDFAHKQFNGITVAADWIRDLEASDSRLHKERVIEKALMAAKLGSANAQCFLFNCYQAYNPYYTFHVKQVPESEGIEHAENPWPVFWGLLEGLRTRSFSGHRARDAILETMKRFDSLEWNNLCRRVLIKDLRCGISEKTLNKVLGRTEWKIPVFSCQLAQDSTDQPKKLKGIKRLECKLDGVRVLAVVQGTDVTLYSRNGKVFENFPQIAQAIEDNRKASGLPYTTPWWYSFVLDGEIVGESFQKLMKQAHRKSVML